jgi:thiol:disulfide interchange protein DsbG
MTFSADVQHRETSRRSLLRAAALPLVAALCYPLAACSPQDAAQKPVAGSVKAADSYALLGKEGRGFTAGSMMSNNIVYVMFDPQCPHCGHLWEQSLPLQKKVKFVWMPVAFIGPKSTPQGAALLTSPNPVEAMAAHEASLLAGTGGTAASSSIPDDIAAAIKKNTDLFNSMGVESVPYIVAKNASTGAVVTNAGSLETAALEQFLGLN